MNIKKDAFQKHGKLASWQQIQNEKAKVSKVETWQDIQSEIVLPKSKTESIVSPVSPRVTGNSTTVETFNDTTPIVEAETIPTKKFAKKKVEE